MKTIKSLPVLIALVLTFAFILSCEEEGRLETRISPSPPPSADGVRFDGSEGDPIDLTTAKKWVANFRGSLKNAEDIQAHYFGHEIIKNILSQPGCVGIRMYYAFDDSGVRKLILVGVGADGENLLPSKDRKSADGNGNTTADYSWPCPDYCPGNGL